MINKILIASGNKGKLKEIAHLLGNIGITAISAADFNLIEPEEIGKTFEENSIIKARFYGEETGLISLADDSGLCVEALGGSPGIHSARWAVDENGQKNFNLAFEKIKKELADKNVNLQNVRAYFICNLTLYFPETGILKSFEGRVDGTLTFPPRGDKGFGYDPIFIADGMNQTFGEIFPDEKDKISHRAKAFEQLVLWLKNNN